MNGKAKRRVRQNSPISSFPTPGVCDWKSQDKSYLSLAQVGAWLHVSLGQDWSPQGHNVPPFPFISAQGCTWRVWSNLRMWQHRAAARLSLKTKAKIQRNGRKQKHSHLPLPDLLSYHRQTGIPALAEWAFGEMQTRYKPPTHWHSFSTNTKNAFMLTSSFLPSLLPWWDKSPLGTGKFVGWTPKCLETTGLVKGSLHRTGKICNQFLTGYWTLWWWSWP